MTAARESRRPGHRLPAGVRPERVALHVEVDPARSRRYRGELAIDLRIRRGTRSIRLHAVGLRVSRPRLEAGGRTRRGRIRWLPAVEMIEVQFRHPVEKGEATLHLAFSGRLRRDLCGLYGVTAGGRRFAFTQLEATEARKFFPCFDEPEMKARFRLSVTTDAGNAVLSNSPVERARRRSDGRKTTHFAQTPPLSTYLVALAVGALESSRPARIGPTEIRVWHVPGKRRLTAFSLEAARECLARLERYFSTPYPYAKLDLVAVPDFEFGAMENAGAVFFRETLLLLDPATATLTEKKRAAEVICHELAHMWYGNLVTMAWWDDLWLNEAFATWMAFAIVDDWRPEWRIWHDFQHDRAEALELDALRNTHPIYCRVRTPAEANENFDRITYEKGASVVRMLERFLGPATFRKGVRLYLRRHGEGNARAADLWRALSEASGEPVEPVARAWTEREGYPLLELHRTEGRGGVGLRLRQERFAERPTRRRAATRRPAPPWPIPWVGRIGTGRAGRGRLERRLLTRACERIDLGRGSPRFVYGNAEESGFFRPLHGRGELRALIASLSSLRPVERMGLVDHQWALVRAGRAPIDGFLELAAALDREPDPDVLRALLRPLRFLADSLLPDAAPASEERFRIWLRERFGPAFGRLGWDPAPGEEEEVRQRRAVLLAIAGGVGAAPPLLDRAAERCDRYLASRRSLDANLADVVVALGARVGERKRQQRFVDAMSAAVTPQEQRRFLLALADFRDPRRIGRTLSLSLTEVVASQDVVSLLARMLANPAAREHTWRFMVDRWPRLRRRVPPLLASRLIDATPALMTPTYRRAVARFFRDHPVPGGERALRQALERFDWYRGFRREAARRLAAWLDGRRPPSPEREGGRSPRSAGEIL